MICASWPTHPCVAFRITSSNGRRRHLPLEWIDYKEAARLYHQNQVAYTCGSLLYQLYGGTNAITGKRTVLDVNSIVATIGHTGNPGNTRHDYVPR